VSEDNKKSEDIQWHSALREVLRDYFAPYRSFVDLIWERPLTSEALIMDGLIIKKGAGRTIPNAIGVFFKTWNIVEYKSPDDSFGLGDLRKVLAYANLLAMEKKMVWEDMTITIIRTGKAKTLFTYLMKKPGCIVEEQVDAQGKSIGIYRISGYADIGIQVVQSEKLPEQDALFLKHLRKHLNTQTLLSLLRKNTDITFMEAYFQVLLKANENAFKEINKMVDKELIQMLADSPMGEQIFELKRQKAEREWEKAEQKVERQRQAFIQCLQNLGMSAEDAQRQLLQAETV
jgi:hypothetical protein